MPKKTLLLISLAALLAISAQALAHHAFSAEFDAMKPVQLRGNVTKMDWINPHAWIHMSVKKTDGTTEEWMVEGGTPNTLLRRGITRDSLQVGTEIVVTGYLAKNGLRRVNGRDLTFPDGRKLFMATSNPFEGTDQKDK